MGQLALQVGPPEREQSLAQPGHVWPLQHISQKASSNRAARAKITLRRRPGRRWRSGDLVEVTAEVGDKGAERLAAPVLDPCVVGGVGRAELGDGGPGVQVGTLGGEGGEPSKVPS